MELLISTCTSLCFCIDLGNTMLGSQGTELTRVSRSNRKKVDWVGCLRGLEKVPVKWVKGHVWRTRRWNGRTQRERYSWLYILLLNADQQIISYSLHDNWLPRFPLSKVNWLTMGLLCSGVCVDDTDLKVFVTNTAKPLQSILCLSLFIPEIHAQRAVQK